MRSFLLLLLLVFFPCATTALKGVRGPSTRRFGSAVRELKKEKKCKKYKESKASKDSNDVKASAKEGEVKAIKDIEDEPKEAKESEMQPKAAKESGEPKAAKEVDSEPKAAKEVDSEPKAAKEVDGESKSAKEEESKSSKEGEPKAAKMEEERECLEWEEVESMSVTEPAMGSSGTVTVDCDAIASDSGPTNTHSVSFSVNMDLVKSDTNGLQSIYSAMEKELQSKVAPRIAGCTSSSSRKLSEGSSTIVNVDFGDFELDVGGCDSSLAQEAAGLEGTCTSSDIPVDVFFVGDFPESAMAKVEVAIEEHEWNVDGLLATSEVDIVQTGSSMGDDGGMNPGAFAGIGLAIVACAAIGFYMYRRSQNDTPVAKAEVDTDEESDDEKEKKKKGDVPQVEAKPVGRW